MQTHYLSFAMTLISKLGYKPPKKEHLQAPFLKSVKDITVIIPAKDNQHGINLFLETFFKTHTPESYPDEIIIIDNNSALPVSISKTYPVSVKLINCSKPGPASARNAGARLAQTEWLYFTDSDCIPTSSLLTGFLSAQNGAVGYAGNIKAFNSGLLSVYYESQEILLPPKIYEFPNTPTPDYLITANCLVWRPAFEKIGGFNELITIAGGEDIDLGFKLRTIGQLSYAFESIALHNFEEDIASFRKRFRRYGKGNKIISNLYDLDLLPVPFLPNKLTLANLYLAILQYLALRKGYKSNI